MPLPTHPRSLLHLRDMLREMGVQVEVDTLRQPPADYGAFRHMVGYRSALREIEEAITVGMKNPDDD